jgi:hypothetical protein
MTSKHTITLRNESGEEATLNVTISTWHYPATLEDPEDSGIEVKAAELDGGGEIPDWIDDDMIIDEIEKIDNPGEEDGWECED